jgi:hypothetical protein
MGSDAVYCVRVFACEVHMAMQNLWECRRCWRAPFLGLVAGEVPTPREASGESSAERNSGGIRWVNSRRRQGRQGV